MKVIRNNRTNVDCTLIAAFNASSWCKKYKTYKEIAKIAKSCGYASRKGLMDFQFVNLLKKLGLPFKRLKGIHIDDVESEIYMGKCYLITYFPFGYTDGHIVTAFLDKNGNIKVVNPDWNRITWPELASSIYSNHMKGWMAYELPCRELL